MGAAVGEGKEVNWANGVVFTQQGPKITPRTLFGKKEPFVLPYEEIDRYNVNEGVFSLWRRGTDKPVLTLQAGEGNFFPGCFLLGAVLTPEEPAHGGSTEQTAAEAAGN